MQIRHPRFESGRGLSSLNDARQIAVAPDSRHVREFRASRASYSESDGGDAAVQSLAVVDLRITSTATPTEVWPLAVMPANACFQAAQSVPLATIGYAMLSNA